MTNRIPGDERWRRELSELLTRIGTMNRRLTRPPATLSPIGEGKGCTGIELRLRPHWQALNLNPNRNLTLNLQASFRFCARIGTMSRPFTRPPATLSPNGGTAIELSPAA